MIIAPEFIPVAGPWITEREAEYAADAARNAWFKDHYAYNARFERLFADYIGVKHAVSLPHCTAAIHLALAAAGIGAGDEVIVPDVTWIASVAPVVYVGATPVFVDIRTDTWCLDVEAVEAAITEKTRAIIGVDLYGSMADWSKLRALADKHDLFLLEDAAEALGSEYHGRKAGALGDVGVFSFHGSKTVVTGEGGMLVTNDDHLHARVMTLRDHGRPTGDRFFLNDEVGFKYKMSAMQAAVGLAQMERIDELIARKRQIFAWYKDEIGAIDNLSLNVEPVGTVNSYWMVTIIPDARLNLSKFTLMEELLKRNIDTRPFFSRLSTLPAFKDYELSGIHLPANPCGAHMADCGVNLPSGYQVTQENVKTIGGALREIIAGV